MKKRIFLLCLLVILTLLVHFLINSAVIKAYGTGGTGGTGGTDEMGDNGDGGGDSGGDGDGGGGDSAGDGICGASETCSSTPSDCGSCISLTSAYTTCSGSGSPIVDIRWTVTSTKYCDELDMGIEPGKPLDNSPEPEIGCYVYNAESSYVWNGANPDTSYNYKIMRPRIRRIGNSEDGYKTIVTYDREIASNSFETCTSGRTRCSGATTQSCDGCAWKNQEDCAAKSSTDSDGSSTAYQTAGTVTDYASCSGGSCASNSYSDSCSGTVLTEYGASGSSYTSGTKQCQDYETETSYCSNNRYVRQEWGCSGSPGYCNDAAAADTPIGTNADGDAKDRECGDSQCDNVANAYDNTRVSRECKSYKRDEFKKIHKAYKKELPEKENGDIDEDELKREYPKIAEKVNGTYFAACPKKSDDTACCTSINSCVYNGVCYSDGSKKDIDGDDVKEVCVARSPGQWVSDVEIDCTDGVDEDFDGLIDCDDPDCDGSISGTVKNEQNQSVSSADVSAKKDLTTIKSTTTNAQGFYNTSLINCGIYNLVASHQEYAPQTRYLNLSPNQQATVNFNLALGSSCKEDCTYVADNIIHAGCDGKNGCAFYDSIAKSACDNSQPGWARDYNASHYVTCASGSPQPKIEIQASVTCESGTLVKVTRIVLYNGKPVKLVVAVCG